MPEITVIAHNIRSAHNVGSIFRTCEGFGVKKLILSGYAPYPSIKNDTRLPHVSHKVTANIHKTALGAETMVEFEFIEDIYTVFERLLASEVPVYALEQHIRSENIRGIEPASKFALLLGEEVHGVSTELLEACERIVEIPMYGKKESFNVSVAFGIALYALTD